ncbi:MAG: lipoyl synthase [Chloroflexi bacterium]|nr:lipoyl synthase [Chloroflexota bacterium]
MPSGENFFKLKGLVQSQTLHTVCEEAACPNIGECWGRGTATFMILGDTCTRACSYCYVKTGRPLTVDYAEPVRVAEAAKELGLKFVVVTSVDRDDLPDGGARVFAMTIRALRHSLSDTRVEVLIPDFNGDSSALETVMDARPDVLNHNIETVRRVFRKVRPLGDYDQSLELLKRAKAMNPEGTTKSGMMVGLGETWDEIVETLRDLRSVDTDLLTVGQYLRPSPKHHPLIRFYHPRDFESIARTGRELGFKHVAAGPLVRSSYHAEEQHETAAGSVATEPSAEGKGRALLRSTQSPPLPGRLAQEGEGGQGIPREMATPERRTW